MIKKLIFLSCLILTCSTACPAWALDWKNLHELAEQTSLKQAQADVQANPGALDKLYVLGLVALNLHRDKQAGDIFKKMRIPHS